MHGIGITTNRLDGRDDQDDEVDLLTRAAQVGGLVEARDDDVASRDRREGAPGTSLNVHVQI